MQLILKTERKLRLMHRYAKESINTTQYVLGTTMRKQTHITQIRHGSKDKPNIIL